MTVEKSVVDTETNASSVERRVRKLRFAALRKIQSSDDSRGYRFGKKKWENLVRTYADKEDITSLERINRHFDTPYGAVSGLATLDGEEFSRALRDFNTTVPGGSDDLFATYLNFFTQISYYTNVKYAARYLPLLQKYPDRVDRITYHVTHPATSSGRPPTVKNIERCLKFRDNTKMLPAFFAETFVPRNQPFKDAQLVTEHFLGYENSVSETKDSIRALGRTLVSMLAESVEDGLIGAWNRPDRKWDDNGRDSRNEVLMSGSNRRTAEALLLMRSVHDVIGDDDGTGPIEPHEIERLFRGLLLTDPKVTRRNSPMSMDTLEEFNTQSSLFRFMIGAYIAQEGLSLSEKRVIVRDAKPKGEEAYILSDPAWADLIRRRSSRREVDALITFLDGKRSVDPAYAEEYLDSKPAPALQVGWL